MIGRVALSGRTAAGRWENSLANADLNFFWKTRWRGDHTLVGHIEGAFGKFLDRDSSVALGGSTGLRGYKNNSFVGSQAVLVNFEDRFFFPGEFFRSPVAITLLDERGEPFYSTVPDAPPRFIARRAMKRCGKVDVTIVEVPCR